VQANYLLLNTKRLLLMTGTYCVRVQDEVKTSTKNGLSSDFWHATHTSGRILQYSLWQQMGLQPGLWSGSRKESEVFGWSGSRIFYPTRPGLRTSNWIILLHRTP